MKKTKRSKDIDKCKTIREKKKKIQNNETTILRWIKGDQKKNKKRVIEDDN